MIQIKLVGMSLISYYTKVHLSKWNGSWVVSTKQTINLNIQTAAMFVFFVFDKNGLIKSCSSFEDISVFLKFHGPTLTGASFASTSEVWTSTILEWLTLRDWKVRHRGHFQWHELPTEFHKNLPISSKVIMGGHTDRHAGDVISLTFLFKESRLKKRDHVTGRDSYVIKSQPHNSYSSLNIICMIKSRRMRWAGHVTRKWIWEMHAIL
jgi:hypothetical protein